MVCTKPDEEWCVGQLCADRAKPLMLFEDMRFTSAKEAQEAAERLKEEEEKEKAAE